MAAWGANTCSVSGRVYHNDLAPERRKLSGLPGKSLALQLWCLSQWQPLARPPGTTANMRLCRESHSCRQALMGMAAYKVPCSLPPAEIFHLHT